MKTYLVRRLVKTRRNGLQARTYVVQAPSGAAAGRIADDMKHQEENP